MSIITNNIGFEFGLAGDISVGYELPLYSQNQYTIWEQRANALLGGKSYLTISLFLVKFTVFFEVIGAKITPALRSKFDTIGYGEYCYESDWTASALKLDITGKVDVNECSAGLLAFFLPGDVRDCQWKNYYIDYPLYTLDPLEYAWTGSILEEQCLGN